MTTHNHVIVYSLDETFHRRLLTALRQAGQLRDRIRPDITVPVDRA